VSEAAAARFGKPRSRCDPFRRCGVELLDRFEETLMPARILFALFMALAATGGAAAQNGAVPGLPAPPPGTIDPGATAPRPGQRPDLSSDQRSKIVAAVREDKNRTKTAAARFPTQVGAEVPPAIELYTLPDDALIQVPIAKMFKFVVMDGKVVLVDPTTMRVVEVIEQ
jgi:hypothetical protein